MNLNHQIILKNKEYLFLPDNILKDQNVVSKIRK